MTPSQLSRIAEQISNAKDNRAKAEGRIEQIEAQWQADFGTTDAAVIEDLLAEKKQKRADLEAKKEKLEEELMGLLK